LVDPLEYYISRKELQM